MEKDTVNRNSDEIDLGELLLKFTKVVKRYWILILGFVIVGIGSGVYHFNTQAPVYESTMMLQSDILTEAYSEILTENIERLINEGNYALLAQRLFIGSNEAAQVVGMEIESLEGPKGNKGEENTIFLVTAETTSNAILPNLEKGIIEFLKNNEFVKKRVTLKRQRYKALVNEMRAEGQELDSLKDRVNEGIVSDRQGDNLVLLDPANIYSQALETFKEEVQYQEDLELIESIQLIEGFTPFNKPVRPKMIISVPGGLGTGLFIALAIIFILETRRYLKSIDR